MTSKDATPLPLPQHVFDDYTYTERPAPDAPAVAVILNYLQENHRAALVKIVKALEPSRDRDEVRKLDRVLVELHAANAEIRFASTDGHTATLIRLGLPPELQGTARAGSALIAADTVKEFVKSKGYAALVPAAVEEMNPRDYPDLRQVTPGDGDRAAVGTIGFLSTPWAVPPQVFKALVGTANVRMRVTFHHDARGPVRVEAIGQIDVKGLDWPTRVGCILMPARLG